MGASAAGMHCGGWWTICSHGAHDGGNGQRDARVEAEQESWKRGEGLRETARSGHGRRCGVIQVVKVGSVKGKGETRARGSSADFGIGVEILAWQP